MSEHKTELGPDDRDEELYTDALATMDERLQAAQRLAEGDGDWTELVGIAIGKDATLIARLAGEVDRLSREVEALRNP